MKKIVNVFEADFQMDQKIKMTLIFTRTEDIKVEQESVILPDVIIDENECEFLKL